MWFLPDFDQANLFKKEGIGTVKKTLFVLDFTLVHSAGSRPTKRALWPRPASASLTLFWQAGVPDVPLSRAEITLSGVFINCNKVT